uniref:MHC class I-like antigen recognition-like domain-containing protein n=1 Tax=Naja naja TaxID=35670 RepID=A0A8C6XE22_NAJNA
CSTSSPRSLPLLSRSNNGAISFIYFAILEPSQGLFDFIGLGYVDSQIIGRYDSNSKKIQPRVSWMEKLREDIPQYLQSVTYLARTQDDLVRKDLENMMTHYNMDKGLHTLQSMYGCELWRDGSKGGFMQEGYDGRTFITFDKETFTWVAPDPQAQITQRKRDTDPGYNLRWKSYLEEICIEWLEKYLSYGNETLLRTGEHQGPGWTFLLYGWISCTHSDPLGSLLCSLLALKRILPLPAPLQDVGSLVWFLLLGSH